MPGFSAETAYLFRHALLREAAYQLQLPVDRASLHALALDLSEAILGADADEAAPELARHARVAWQTGSNPDIARLQSRELHWSRVAMKQAQSRYDGDAEIAFALAIIESPVARGEQRCEACYNRANTLQRLGRWEQATQEFLRLHELATQHTEPLHQGQAIYGLGYLDWLCGRIEECDRRMDEWMAFTQSLGNEHEIASSKLAYAVMRLNRGEYARSLELFEEALPRLRKTANDETMTRNLLNYAILLQENSKLREAEETYRVALGLARKTGLREYEASILGGLGTLLKLEGRLEKALEHTREATRIAEEIGNRRGRCIHLSNSGSVLQLLQKNEEALACLKDACLAASEIGATGVYAATTTHIGGVCLALGRLKEGAASLRESVTLWIALEDVAWEAYARSCLARLLRMSGDYDGAAAELSAAEARLQGMQAWADLFCVRGEQSHLALARGESAEAEHAACLEVAHKLDPDIDAARKDIVNLEAAMQAAKNGEKLIHGNRRETLTAELVKAIEG